MKNLIAVLLMLVGCSAMTGCSEPENTVTSEGLTEADFEAVRAENERLEAETEAGG